jgi:hypothetical protein
MKRLASLVLIFLTVASMPAFGQATRGSLTGVVVDSQGAAVSGASVTVKNVATGETFSTMSNAQGAFVFPSLPVGRYSIVVEGSGFKRFEAQDIVIEVSIPAKVDVQLEVGSITEEVTVTGVQEVVNTVSPVLTNVIDRRQILDLPLPTRNPIDLARLQAGIAVPGTNTRQATVAGLRGSSTNITQDGINVMDNTVKTDSFFAISAPSVEATSEFSVSVGTIGSDSGRGVAQVRIVTPSGTNEFHGSVFWFHRNDNLNANTFFNNLTGTPRNIELQNRFGFRASGPFIIPKLYDGRNRSFWFFAYEGFREPFSVTRNRTVLTPEARRGIFRYIGADGRLTSVNLLQIGNAGALNPITMGLINSTPEPNNTLVGDGLNTAGFIFNVKGLNKNDRISLRVDQVLVEKSRLGSHKLEFVFHRGWFDLTPDTFNGLEAPFPGGIDAFQSSTRTTTAAAIQSTFGASATNEVRFGTQRAPVGFLRKAPPAEPFFISFSGITNIQNQFMSQGRNTTVYHFTDNFSLVKGGHTFRMGGEAQSITFHNFNDAGIFPTVFLGTNSANPNGIVTSRFPNLPAGATGQAIVSRASAVFNNITGWLGSAQQTFNVVSPTSGFVPGATRTRPIRQRDISIYFMDQWKVRRNLTFNYGLRWEYITVPTVLNGLVLQPINGPEGLFGISGPGNLFNPGVLKGTAPTVLDFVGGKTGRKLYNNDWNNFAPFIGFAYSPKFSAPLLRWIFGSEAGQSSIRAGFSISYLRDGMTVFNNAMGVGTANPGLTQTTANSTPTGVLTAAGVPVPIPTFKVPRTDLENFQLNPNNGLWAFDPNLRTPYVQQWSLGIERELPGRMAIEIRYVGNHAVKLYRANDFNEVNIFENGFLQEFLNAQKNLAINLQAGVASFAPGRPGTVPLPILSTLFARLPAASGFSNSTFITQLQVGNVGAMASTLAFSPTYAANRANLPPNFFVANPNAAFARLLDDTSYSFYNSLQVELRRRLSRGLFFQADYTFSKAITDSEGSQSNLESYRTLRNLKLDRHRASFDQTHRFVSNFIYELPFGKGRRFLSGLTGPLGKILEGWQVQGIINWQTGQPIFIFSNRSTFNSFNPGLNPAVLLGIDFEELRRNTGVFRTGDGVFFINPALLNIVKDPRTGQIQSITPKEGLLGAPEPGKFGNFPRNGLNSPRFFQTDLSVLKRTSFSESGYVEFRVELFNAFNNPNFAIDSFAFDSTNFGRITGLAGNPRIIQIGLRVNF